MHDFPKEDCYDTLGVHPEASQDLIESTWKKLNKIYHPDQMAGEAVRDKSAAEEKLKTINAAYHVLKDPENRRVYDQWRNARLQPPKPRTNRSRVDFGTLAQGESRTERVLVENSGGPVVGEINFSLSNDPSNFRLSIDATNGFPIPVDIYVDTSDSDRDRSLGDTLTITLDGNSADVALLARVRGTSVDPAPHSPVGSATAPTPAPPPVDPTVMPPMSSVARSASGTGVSRGWAIGLGWIAGFVFLKIIGPLLALILTSSFPQAANGPGWLGLLWTTGCSVLFGVLITSLLRGMKRRAVVSGISAVFLTLLTAVILLVVTVPTRGTTSHASIISEPVVDRLAGNSIGIPTGIRWTDAIGSRGAVFSAADSSRIEYPGLIPAEGTLEFWIKVIDGYRYDNYRFMPNQNDAMIFSSDVEGGDVTWPGTTKIFVWRNGNLSMWMATVKGPNRNPATEARETDFRFGEWHAIGVSYGSDGQYIMLDGRIVASSPSRTQTFGRAGSWQSPLDVPTIGETVSHFWQHHQYEGGFEGTLAAFRVSNKQEDWVLAKGLNVKAPTPGGNTQPHLGAVAPASTQPGAGPSPFGQPLIESISPVLPTAVQTITIHGSGLGTQDAYTGDSDYIRITDLTKGWNAGWDKDPGEDQATLVVSSWTDAEIVLSGFSGAYGRYQNVLSPGDHVTFQVWNPQTKMPSAPYEVVASARSPTVGSPEVAITGMISQWAVAHAANDVASEIAFYAPVVDPYYDHHGVPREFVEQSLQNLLNRGVRLSRYEVVDVMVSMDSDSEATVDLVKVWSTRPGGLMPNHTRSQLRVRSVDGKWLITGERDF